MKTLTTSFAVLILTVVMFTCHSVSNNLNEGKLVDTILLPTTSDTSAIGKTEIVDKPRFSGHPISFYLVHQEIPQVCKDLYTKKRDTSDDSEVIALMDSIFTSNSETRPFYFLTLTSTMKTADAAYAEPLGVMGKRFIETRTKEFINYFINELILTQGDFDQWAKTVAGEIQISSDTEVKEEVKRVKNKMTANCNDCDERQIQKIGEFISRLQYHSP